MKDQYRGGGATDVCEGHAKEGGGATDVCEGHAKEGGGATCIQQLSMMQCISVREFIAMTTLTTDATGHDETVTAQTK